MIATTGDPAVARVSAQEIHTLAIKEDAVTTDEVLDWCGKDVARLHTTYAAELARDPRAQRPALLTQLRDRLGWPLPDTAAAEVLTYAGRPPWPLARVLDTEQARPEPYRRPELIAELRRRVAAAGPNATSVAPKTAATRAGLFS